MHTEATIDPTILNIWSQGRVFDKTTKHGELWIEVSDGPSLFPLGVESISLSLKKLGELIIEIVHLDTDDVFHSLGVFNEDVLDNWEEDEVVHGYVGMSLKIHGKENSNFIRGSLIRADELYSSNEILFVTNNDTVFLTEGNWGFVRRWNH